MIYQHFRKEEHPFIDQVLSWKDIVDRTYQRKLTDFLDPREQQIIEMLIPADDLLIDHYGGGKYTERKRTIIAPFYEQIESEDFQLALLQATYPNKFVTLSHRDIMGAFLSLGIVREKLGDIYVEDGIVQMIVAKEIAPYVIMNLTGIKRAQVKFVEKPLQQFIEKAPEWIEAKKTVASLRLDNVVKEIYNLSRKLATEYIKKNIVKVNYKIVNDGKFMLQEGDMISVRRKGRSKLVQIDGKTRKDKLKITVAYLK